MTTTVHRLRRSLLLVAWSCLVGLPTIIVQGFLSYHKPSWSTRRLSHIAMAKKLKNKQAEMLEKLKKARQQKEPGGEDSDDAAAGGAAEGSTNSRLSKEEIKEQNDRKRFQELLEKSSSMILNDYSTDGYLNKRQEEEEISAQMSGVERLFEGDPAPIKCFEGLVTIQTETPIGKKGAERLIPWFPANSNNYLICICDPRPESHDLKETVKNLTTDLPLDIRSRIIVINADSPAENRRWLKRNPFLEEQNLQVYSDEKKEWMQAYTALDKKRWSMTMFLIADERVQALARDLDMYAASRVVQNAVKKLNEARL